MDPTSPAQLTGLLRRHGFIPRKDLGQSFLIDRNIVNKVLDAVEIGDGDEVVEIGPGAGALTVSIADRGARLVAVEVDRGVVPILRKALGERINVEVVNADFLSLDLSSLIAQHFGTGRRVKVVGNLPYYVTSPIITHLVGARQHIQRMVLMVQKEVGQRLRASPGGKDYGSMSVFAQYYCDTVLVAHVSKSVFLPPPEVSSVILRLTPRAVPPVRVPSDHLFFDVVRCAFGQRRKTLLNSLSDCPVLGLPRENVLESLRAASVDPSRRAETLSLEEFARIAWAVSACRSGR